MQLPQLTKSTTLAPPDARKALRMLTDEPMLTKSATVIKEPKRLTDLTLNALPRAADRITENYCPAEAGMG